MKKIVLSLTIFFLSLSILSCTDAKTEILENISYDVNRSTVEFPYQDYDLNIGATPLFIHALTPIINSEGFYGYINQQTELVIDYQFTKAYNFNLFGYAEVYHDDAVNVIDQTGIKVLDEDLDGWDLYGYHEDYLKFKNYYMDDEPNKILIYDYDGFLLKSYTAENEYAHYTEYPTFSASNHRSNSFIDAHDYPLYDQDNRLLDNSIFSDIEYSYRQMISVAINEDFTESRRYGAYSTDGTLAVPVEYIQEIQFGSLWQFSDLAPIVTVEGLLGFIDYTGEIVIEPTYQQSIREDTGEYYRVNYEFLFNHGVQKVRDNGQDILIDVVGNILFETNEFQRILDYNDELIAVENHFEVDEQDFYVVDVFNYDGQVIYRNESNIDVVFTKDDSDIFFVTSYKTGVDGVSDQMYNHDGELLMEGIEVIQKLWNDTYTSFVHGALVVKDLETEKLGFINETGEWMIDPEFEEATGIWWDSNNYIFYSDGYAVVSKDDKYGVIDKQGNYLIECVLYKSPMDILDFYQELIVPESQSNIY